MVMHVGMLAGPEIKYPGTKVVVSEERDETLVFIFCSIDGLVDIGELHDSSCGFLPLISPLSSPHNRPGLLTQTRFSRQACPEQGRRSAKTPKRKLFKTFAP